MLIVWLFWLFVLIVGLLIRVCIILIVMLGLRYCYWLDLDCGGFVS